MDTEDDDSKQQKAKLQESWGMQCADERVCMCVLLPQLCRADQFLCVHILLSVFELIGFA